MDLSMQAKLLRVLEEKSFRRSAGEGHQVDVRVISATNQNLSTAMTRGSSGKTSTTGCRSFPSPCPAPGAGEGHHFPSAAFRAAFQQGMPQERPGHLPRGGAAPLDSSWPGMSGSSRNVIERAMIFEIDKEILPEHLPQELLHRESAPAIPAAAPISWTAWRSPRRDLH